MADKRRDPVSELVERPEHALVAAREHLAAGRVDEALAVIESALDDDAATRIRAILTGVGVPPIPAELAEVLEPVVRSPMTIASWFMTPEPELGGESPASWLQSGRDFDAVFVQAQRFAWRLDQ